MKRLSKPFILILFLMSHSLWAGITVEELQKSLANLGGTERIQVLVRLSELFRDDAPAKTVEYSLQALKELEEFPAQMLELRTLLALALAFQNLGQYENAISYCTRAGSLAKQLNHRRSLAVSYNLAGFSYLRLMLLDRSLDNVLHALKLFRQLQDKNNMAEAYKNIGNIYRHMKNSKQTLTYYLKALELWKELGNQKGVARMLNNVGMVYGDSGQHKRALLYYNRGLVILKQLKWKFGIIVILGNIATVHNQFGNQMLSLKYLQEALDIANQLGTKRLIAVILSNMAVDYRHLKQYKKALDYAYRALEIAKEIKGKDIIRNFYEELSYIYDAMKDYKNAFLFIKKYKATEDEIFSQEAKKNIQEKLLKLQTETKEKEIRALTQHNHIQKLKLEQQTLIRNFLMLISLLVIVLTMVLYSRYRSKRKTEQVLLESQRKLKRMNASKDKLFSIIAHDLGSPLNSLLLSSNHLERHYRNLEEEEIKEFLHQIYNDSNRMSKLLNNLLQWALTQLGRLEPVPESIGLKPVVEETIELMHSHASEKEISVVSSVSEHVYVYADRHMLETVLRNLLGNAVKYSFKNSEIRISSTPGKDSCCIAVHDSGTGIPVHQLENLFQHHVHNSTTGTDGEKGTGLGLLLCKEMAEKNNGHIRLESQPGMGTTVFFHLPAGARGENEQSI